MFEPVGKGEGTAGSKQFGGVGEKAGDVLIVRDRFDGPENVKALVEKHGFGIHAEKSCGGAGLSSSFTGHFDLWRRDGDADGLRLVFLSKVDAAGAEAAADVENSCLWLKVGSLGETFDELQLGDFFGFIATDPKTVMEMLAPKRTVVGTGPVVMVKDALLVIGAKHGDVASLAL